MNLVCLCAFVQNTRLDRLLVWTLLSGSYLFVCLLKLYSSFFTPSKKHVKNAENRTNMCFLSARAKVLTKNGPNVWVSLKVQKFAENTINMASTKNKTRKMTQRCPKSRVNKGGKVGPT